MNARKLRSAAHLVAAFALFGFGMAGAPGARAQTSGQEAESYTVTDADRAAVVNAKVATPHAMPIRSTEDGQVRAVPGTTLHRNAASASALVAPTAPTLRYPADLTYQGGTPLQSTEHHAIYLLPNGHCRISECWGNPEGFLADLSRSDFIHITDQYVGASANNRYPVGRHAFLGFTPPFNFSTNSHPLTDADMVAAVHAVASKTGNTGHGHLYHVFLPKGTDECFDNTYSVCYSPDNGATFYFCAYHGYADFSDIGHVLYTVEPYQNVPGCDEPPGTPNGQLIDSTNNVLSHETFEAITDPDLDAWWNNGGNLTEGGSEIGDECAWIGTYGGKVYWNPGYFSVGEKTYAAQFEYDNAQHACALAP